MNASQGPLRDARILFVDDIEITRQGAVSLIATRLLGSQGSQTRRSPRP